MFLHLAVYLFTFIQLGHFHVSRGTTHVLPIQNSTDVVAAVLYYVIILEAHWQLFAQS